MKMQDIYEKNLLSLQRHRPELYESLKPEIDFFKNYPNGSSSHAVNLGAPALAEEFAWSVSNDFVNLAYRRREEGSASGSLEAILHTPNPQIEAEHIVTRTKTERASMILMMGMGLGHILFEILKRRTKYNFVIGIIESNPQFFLRALNLHDFTPVFENSSIHFMVQRNLSRIVGDLHRFFYRFTEADRAIHILGCPTPLAIDEYFYQHLRSRLGHLLDEALLAHGNSVQDSFEGLQNTVDNLPAMLKNWGFNPFRNLFEGKTCISVASGPSLNDHWDQLRAAQGKIPIIACDSAFRKLVKEGIQPDWVTAIERVPMVAEYFKGTAVHERTTFIATAVVQKNAFDAFRGRHLYFTTFQEFNYALGLQFIGQLYTGHSAGNLNINLATHLGFSNVIMVGHNLAFGLGTHESHYQGIGDDRETHKSAVELESASTKAKVPTQDGLDEVYTLAEYNLFRAEIENYVAENPHNNYINVAAKGAKIAGAKLMSMQEALQAYGAEGCDHWSKVRPIFENLDEMTIQNRTHLSETLIRKSKERIEYWLKRNAEIQKHVLSWKKKIENADAKGKKISIEELNASIQFVQNFYRESDADSIFQAAAVTIMMPERTHFRRKLNQWFVEEKDEYVLRCNWLKAHETYVEFWNDWLPKIRDEYRRAEKLVQSSETSQTRTQKNNLN